jgi:hypothetical protein
MQHVSVAGGLESDDFETEIGKAHERYYQVAKAVAPWLQVRPMKSAAEAWADLQERRKDPVHMAWVAKEQKLLDDRAAKYKEAVKQQLELADIARGWEQKRRAALKRPIGKRHGRLPSRKKRV